tara:strand:+ start:1909 stop:2184 length:276 start_codon:yes stop_codon:yes gene_type:complete
MSKMGQYFLALQEAGIIPMEDFYNEDRGEYGDACDSSEAATGSDAGGGESLRPGKDHKGNQCGASASESLSSKESNDKLEDHYCTGWNQDF